MAIVRLITNNDHLTVRMICANTAFFGEPVEAFFDDRNLYLDAFLTYYLIYEPQRFWVVEVDGCIAGYLSGCISTVTKREVNRKKVLPNLIKNTLSGKYHLGRKTIKYITRILREQGSAITIDLNKYPAHLHMNLLKEYRGQGLGTLLMNKYLQQVANSHISGIHIITTNQNTSAEHLYSKFGFSPIATSETDVYKDILPKPVHVVAYARNL